jgi:pSer/pThr/pTyr-binding forkhead associated (FHA) protein
MSQKPLDRFRRACGLDGPLTLEVIFPGGAGPVSYRLEQPFAVVGRSTEADLSVDQGRVSRRHAFLQVIAGGLFAVDLQSKSGLGWVSGTREETHDCGWLEPGLKVRVGDALIGLGAVGVPPAEDGYGGTLRIGTAQVRNRLGARTTHAGLDGLVRGSLELPIRIQDETSVWSLSGPLSFVGRSPQAHLCLGDLSVSRFHAAFVCTTLGVWVVDLLSREGVCVNGVPVRWAWLDEADVVRLGRQSLVFRYPHRPQGIRRDDVPLEAGRRPSDTSSAGSTGGDSHLPARVDRRPSAVARTGNPGRAPAVPVQPEWNVPATELWTEPPSGMPAGQAAMMQQQMQMLESFHQNMIMMVQMFMAMHRDHLDSVRAELDRVQQLSRELNELQTRLGREPASLSGPQLEPVPRPAARQARSGPAEASPPRERPARSERNGTGAKPSRKERATPANHLAPSASRQKDADRTALRSTGSGAHLDDPSSPTNVHILLTQRIAELQRERQGYWQKILSSLTGSGTN